MQVVMQRLALVLFAFCLPAKSMFAASPAYEWKLVTMKAAWAPRDGAGLLSYQGKLWLLGGWNPDRAQRQFFPRICNNEVWSSVNGLEWSLVKPNTFLDSTFDPSSDWEGRHTAGYAVFQGKMWIVGGDCNQRHYQNDVWNSVDGKTWTQVNRGKTLPWAPRALHYTVVHDGKLWVIGGQTMPAFAEGKEAYYRDVLEFHGWRGMDAGRDQGAGVVAARNDRRQRRNEWSHLDSGWRDV